MGYDQRAIFRVYSLDDSGGETRSETGQCPICQGLLPDIARQEADMEIRGPDPEPPQVVCLACYEDRKARISAAREKETVEVLEREVRLEWLTRLDTMLLLTETKE